MNYFTWLMSRVPYWIVVVLYFFFSVRQLAYDPKIYLSKIIASVFIIAIPFFFIWLVIKKKYRRDPNVPMVYFKKMP